MSRPQKPFNLTHIELAHLPKTVQDWSLRDSSIARTWADTLDEAVLGNLIKPALADRLLHRLMPATVRAIAEHTFKIPEVRMSGPVDSYGRYDHVYTLDCRDVTITLPPGEPNPMDGYIPPPVAPPRSKIKGKGKAENPYDLTGGDEGGTSTHFEATLPPSPPDTPAKGKKRTHATMAYSSSSSAAPKTGAKSQPLTITIPKLRIILYPSGFTKHLASLPAKERPAISKALAEAEKQRMVELGLKREVRRRGPIGPRKKRKMKSEDRVGEEDLAEDEVE